MKLISLLLALLLCCCGVACADAPVDPVLVELPEDQMFGEYWPYPYGGHWLVDDDWMLTQVFENDEYRRGLLNLTTGEFVPLTLSENFDVGPNRLYQRNPEGVLRSVESQKGSHCFVGSDRYILLNSTGWVCIADRETGVLQSPGILLNMEECQVGLTPWDEIYRMWRNGAVVYTLEGEGVCNYISPDGEFIIGVHPMDEGFLMMTLYEKIRFESDVNPLLAAYAIRLTVTDKRLNTLLTKELGMLPYEGSGFTCYHSQHSGTLILSTDGDQGMLLLTPEGEAYVLVDMYGKLCIVPYESSKLMVTLLAGTHGVSVVGVADNGSYALIMWNDDGLYKLDLKTLELTQQMTREEFDALGIEGGTHLFWPGGEYLNDEDGQLYRLVDRSTLPAE